MHNERVKQVKIRKGSSWFYSKHTINGEPREINTRVRIRGQRPEKFNLRGDAEFEASKMEAIIAASNIQRDLEKRRSQEELANLAYEAQTGGQHIPTFKIIDLYEIWLNKPHKPSIVSDKRKQFCKTVIARFTKFITLKYPTAKTVHHITPTMAREFLGAEKRRGVSESTYNDVLFLMKCVFKEAGATAFKKETPDDSGTVIHRIPFEEKELLAVKKAAESDIFLYPIVITAICTGMRLGDCCRLKWNDIDFKEKVVRVKTHKTKKVISVPIFDWLADELDKPCYANHSSIYVFPEQERKHRSNSKFLNTRLKKVLRTAGFADNHGATLISCDEIDGTTLHEKTDKYLISLPNKEKAERMRCLFDAYLTTKSLKKACVLANIHKSTASAYLGEIEKVTGIPFIRGRLRPSHTGTPLKPITQKRETGLRKTSIRGFHSFRSTWVTLALQGGVPIETVMLVTGHTTVQIVLTHYFNPSQKQIRDTLSKALPFSDKQEEVK